MTTRPPRPSRKRAALALLVPALGLFACSGGDADAPVAAEEGEGFPRDSLVIAYQSDADVLLSVVYQSASDSQIISNLNYPVIDADFDCELIYKPGIFTSWEWSEDGKVIRFAMRDDLKWSDGVPVTAQDVQFTYDLIADPAVASPRYAYIERMVPDKRPLIIDDHTVEFHFTEAYDRTTQLAHSSMTLVAKHALESTDRATLRGSDYARNPLINGQWKLGSWDRGQRIVLEGNEKFTGPAESAAKLKRVIFKIIPEYATRLVELENGSVDMMEAIQVADADRLAKEHPEIKLNRRGWRSFDYIAWNSIDGESYKAAVASAGDGNKVDPANVKPNPLFADAAARRALSKAINVDKLINDLLTSQVTGEKYGKRAVSFITPSMCKVHNSEIEPLPHDLAAAKSELEALGWKDTDGDGILDKDGVPFSFRLLTNSGNPRRAKASVIVQANLKEIGVNVEIEKVESNLFFERLRKKDFDAALSGWSAGLFVDPTDIWHSGPEHEFNFVSYNNPRADELIEQGMKISNPEDALPVWLELQQHIYEDQPYTFLYWMDEIVGVNSRFEDTKVDILSSLRDVHEWWVPADKVKYKN